MFSEYHGENTMIKKLRRKIFWSIELSAIAVLFIILAGYDTFQIIRNQNEEWKMLSSVMESVRSSEEENSDVFSEEKKGQKDGFGKKKHMKGGKNTARLVNDLVSGDVCLIETDTNGNVSIVSGFLEDYQENEKNDIIYKIVNDDKNKGRIGPLKFMKESFGEKGIIAVRDSGYINRDSMTLILISLFGLIVSGAVFAGIAYLIASLIVKPVEESIRNQEQFIADASHELKTPVSVMQANIAVLEKEVGQNKWMDYIKEQGKRISELTNDMLLLSKIDYEKNDKTVLERINLSNAIMEAALPFESIAFEKRINYEIHVRENIFIRGNAEEIKKIAGILIDNAVKHTEQDGWVTVEADKNYMLVKNTGENIPPEVLPYLFDRFYKADSSRKYEENSFGLGLAIAKSLVEKNEGEISASSGGGNNIFKVTFTL